MSKHQDLLEKNSSWSVHKRASCISLVRFFVFFWTQWRFVSSKIEMHADNQKKTFEDKSIWNILVSLLLAQLVQSLRFLFHSFVFTCHCIYSYLRLFFSLHTIKIRKKLSTETIWCYFMLDGSYWFERKQDDEIKLEKIEKLSPSGYHFLCLSMYLCACYSVCIHSFLCFVYNLLLVCSHHWIYSVSCSVLQRYRVHLFSLLFWTFYFLLFLFSW